MRCPPDRPDACPPSFSRISPTRSADTRGNRTESRRPRRNRDTAGTGAVGWGRGKDADEGFALTRIYPEAATLQGLAKSFCDLAFPHKPSPREVHRHADEYEREPEESVGARRVGEQQVERDEAGRRTVQRG